MATQFQPYVGPRPFEEADRHLFFGRNGEANELQSLIVAHPAVLVYAQSGAGKTSLLNAKIIPSLKQAAYQVLPLARVHGIEADVSSNIYVLNTLVSWANGDTRTGDLPRMSLAEFLKKRPHVERVRNLNGNSDKIEEEVNGSSEKWELPRFAIFDQFEELFTSYPHRWKERREFFEQIRAALDEDYLLRVVFIMREDYVAEIDPYAALLPERLRVRTRLERLRENAALDAVKKPLEFTNRRFADGVADRLVSNLMMSSNGEPGSEQFVETLQLQVVCHNLWQALKPNDLEITLKHLEHCGDVNQALMTFYEKSIQTLVGKNGLPDGEHRITEGDLRRWFEKVLITPEKKRAPVDRRAARTGGMPNDAIIGPLERVQLIKGEWRAGARWYELSHDRFIEPILTSNQKWLAEQSTTEQTHQRLENRAMEYAQGTGGLLNEDELHEARRLLSDQSKTHITPSRQLRHLVQISLVPEQKRKMKTMRLAVAAAVVVVVLIGSLAISAVNQRTAANTARTKADAERTAAVTAWAIAEARTKEAQEQKAEADKQRKEAEEQKREAEIALARAQKAELDARKERDEAQKATRNAVQARKDMEVQKKLAEARGDLLEKKGKAESWNSYGFGLSQGGTTETTEKAIRAHNEALRQYELLGDLNGKANTLTYLGRVYADQARPAEAPNRDNNYAEAEKYYQQALALREQTSPDSNELARAINYVGVVYDEQDKPEKDIEAERFYRQALEVRERILHEKTKANSVEPTFYTDLGNSYRNLASLYQELGRYNEAMEFAKKAGEISVRFRGWNTGRLDMALALNQIGTIYYFQGKYNQAEPNYQEALRIYKSERAPAHLIATNQHNLGLLYFQLAKYKEAEQLENESITMKRKATIAAQTPASFISNHDGLAVSLVTLARIHRELGSIPEAEQNYIEAVDEMIKARGNEGRRVAIMKNYQAEFYAAEGKNLPLAEKLEQEARAILNKGYKTDHWFVSRSLATLAGIRMQQGKHDEAESFYKQALPNLKVKLGEEHPEVAATQTGLAKLYIAEGHYRDAESLLKEALAIRERIEPNHPYVADVLETYSTLLQRTGRETEAKEKIARAQAIREKVRAAYEK